MIKHASSSVEHDGKAEEHNEQPKPEEAFTEVPQYTQFVSLREPEIDVAPIL
jgi:hypothetical protein